MTLLFSILALLLGPFIYAVGRRQPTIRLVLDGFIFAAVAGIVCVDIIPNALISGGAFALLALAFGLAFPVVAEKTFGKAAHKAHVFVVILAAIGLIVHAVIDGIALLPDFSTLSERGSPLFDGKLFGGQLALGVILHRIPVGMAIWWSVRASFGSTAAIATFGFMIAATSAAYFFGAPIVAIAETQSLALFQAFVAGSLVHIVAFGVSHDHSTDPVPAGQEWGYRVGILIGMFVIFSAPNIH
jgi:hypothetical protein